MSVETKIDWLENEEDFVVKVSRKKTDYKITDIELASWGHKEIAIAETEMPGLIAVREEFKEQQL